MTCCRFCWTLPESCDHCCERGQTPVGLHLGVCAVERMTQKSWLLMPDTRSDLASMD